MSQATFRHHPDGFIGFEDGAMVKLSDFILDEPDYALPAGIVRLEYVRGQRLSFFSEDSQYGVENCPGLVQRDVAAWVARLERYCARADFYKAGALARELAVSRAAVVAFRLPVEQP